jgi:ABC-type nitrate/sulfonate/bicarbonate transport system substrate-binding protein
MVSPRAHREIRRIEDLDGATVGVAGVGSDEDMMIRFVCSRHGDLAKIKAVSVGAGMSKVLALEQGSVDVVAAVGTTVSLIRKRYSSVRILFDLWNPACHRNKCGLIQQLGATSIG